MVPHSVRGPTYRRAIKEVSKAVNFDRINNQAHSLSQNIYVITNIFIMNNYLLEMIRKIIFTNYFIFLVTRISSFLSTFLPTIFTAMVNDCVFSNGKFDVLHLV